MDGNTQGADLKAAAAGARAGRSRSGRVLSVVFDVFTVVVVIFVIFLLVIMFQLKGLTTDGISVAGYRMFLVQTNSMSPVYPAGSMLLTKKVPVAEIKEGDVISFLTSYSGAVLTHRVVEVMDFGDGTYSYTTKGDANMANDVQSVHSQAVLGVAMFGVPKLGLFVKQMRSVWGLILLVILPSTLVIVGESFKLARTVREEKAKKADDIKADGDVGSLAGATAADGEEQPEGGAAPGEAPEPGRSD